MYYPGLHHALKWRYNSPMDDPCATYRTIKQAIDEHTASAGRPAGSVNLLAVSKRQSVGAIRTLAKCGQKSFGENYLQEAKEKIQALKDLSLSWHFIGPLQSNKAAEVAQLFDWVHTVDREKIARRLNAARAANDAPLNVCIQVNISGEKSKNGIQPADLAEFAASIRDFANLRLLGLMALPAPQAELDKQRQAFRELRNLYIETFGPAVDTLSIGTSQDYAAAILEGATIIRIGTALFGPRQ